MPYIIYYDFKYPIPKQKAGTPAFAWIGRAE